MRVFPPGVPLLTILLGVGLNRLWPLGLGFVSPSPAHYRFAIVPEESYLERKFGEEYLSYKRRVRRWL